VDISQSLIKNNRDSTSVVLQHVNAAPFDGKNKLKNK
jgi:hypothetical protein